MESSSKTVSGTGNNTSGGINSGSNSSSADNSDIYEFKSTKDASSSNSSPNPGSEKEKDSNQNQGSSNLSGSGSSVNNPSDATGIEDATATVSPSSKRPFEPDGEELDDENKKKKRKDSDNAKENTKSTTSGGRQGAGRNSAAAGEKCAKSGKQSSSSGVSKGNQASTSLATDRKSPIANSPKPSNTGQSSTTGSKASATISTTESDNEDDRSKNPDSSLAPKVPPLKIVIPPCTTSEQEQGNRNGKNTSNRGHPLPYVVASSNSNDSSDKDQAQTASGTTSPTDSTSNPKTEDKKDTANEERTTHHQRVLRSSHRSGNGSNGSTSAKDASSGNLSSANYSNASPLPSVSTDRSNNSSPQQIRYNSPAPDSTYESNSKTTSEGSVSGLNSKASSSADKSDKNFDNNAKSQKDGNDNPDNASLSASTSSSIATTTASNVQLHPRKRKMKPNKEAQAASAAANESVESSSNGPEIHPHDQPITNCVQLFLNIRKQIDRRRKGLFLVQPKPPQGFKDYLMNRCTYVLAGNAKEPIINYPVGLAEGMKEIYADQEKQRHRLRMQHVVEKEKLVLSVEQEILRVHSRAARALANQSVPFSVCTILKDEEVYNVITPEQEEKDRNARSRYNGRLFLSWLQDVDDKWEKIKEAMLLRHHKEAEALHAVQRMDWEWKLKELGLCEFKVTPQIDDIHVPKVHVSDDFDLLPA